MPKKSGSRECTNECKSKQHANELISAISLPCSIVTDKQLAHFLKSKCCCYDTVQDDQGRMVLHIASSCGRQNLCRWLLKYSDANVDSPDAESGYTSLHRSLLFGHIDVAVTLIQLGASLCLTDRNDYFPTDLVQLDLKLNLSNEILNLNSAEKDESAELNHSKNNRRHASFDVSYNSLCQSSSIKHDVLSAATNAFVTEVYTWGINLNYTIGFGAESSKQYPEYLEFFEKRNEVVIQICMQKYHTLFVSLSGNVWSCGLGHGGRLGLAFEDNVLIPQKVSLIPLPSRSRVPSASKSSPTINKSLFCIRAAIGIDHSIFMCNDNQVLICGINTYHQLGIVPPPTSINIPQAVDIDLCNTQVAGIGASNFHSVVWTSNAVYSCGLHAGQLGHEYSNEKTVPYFKKVNSIDFRHSWIVSVAVSEGATVVMTEMHTVFLLSGYKCQKIELRHVMTNLSSSLAELKRKRYLRDHIDYYKTDSNDESIKKILVQGGQLDVEKVKSYISAYRAEGLKIAILMWEGSVYFWQENVNRFLRCHFVIKRELVVTDLTLNSIGILLCTLRGEAYFANVQNLIKTFRKVSDGFTAVNQRNNDKIDECYRVKLKRIQNAFRCVRIYSDPKGDNYAIIQNRSINELENVPEMNTSTFTIDFESFYEEINELDPFHDIVFQVGKKLFPAHKFILASCCEDFKLSEEKNGIICVEKTHPTIFEQLLLFAYTGTCQLLQEGPCSIKIPKRILDKHLPAKYDDPLKLATKLVLDFKVSKLVELLCNFRYENEFIYFKSDVRKEPTKIRPQTRLQFNRLNFKNLYDIKLKSQDGQVFNAHKCIIVARMQYFKNMLYGSWMESSNAQYEHQLSVSAPVLNEILEFVYTDTVMKKVNKKELNFWCGLLVAADQFILLKLKEISENAISQCLDTRNVCEILLLADVIRAEQLKLACYEFICTNLSCLLYSRTLEKLNDSLLHEITVFYRTNIRFRYRNSLKERNIPVYSDACDPISVINAEHICQINWDLNLESYNEKEKMKKSTKVPKKKQRTKKCLSSEMQCGGMKESSTNRENAQNEIQTHHLTIMKKETKSNKDAKPVNEWTEVDRQMKSVMARLKVNTSVRESPQLVEQKENYVLLSLNSSLSSPNSDKEMSTIQKSPRSPNYTLDIDFQNLSPKVSQNEMKRQRRTSESRKGSTKYLPPKNAWDRNFTSPSPEECQKGSCSGSDCWGPKISKNPISFSAIMASEKKQKTMIKKETKKIETKSLHLTQIEDKAIQELIALYDASNTDDERITVRRVIHKVALPQWVTK